MRTTSESLDLYTLWKRDEELHQRQMSPAPLPQPIPLRSDTSKFLVPSVGQVFHTDGYSSLKADDRYERTLFEEEMEVPSIGTERKNFDLAEMISFDILGESTRLPLMCKMIIYQQGATHEREPPILVRDVCVQWNGYDRPRSQSVESLSSDRYEFGLQRARSSDQLLSTMGRPLQDYQRCASMNSSMTEDDDASSVMTVGGTVRHRVSRLLHRHKYQRQIDTSLVGRSEFYSVPFYQYRGRRYGPKDMATQMNEGDLNERYSVTVILPVRDRQETVIKGQHYSSPLEIHLRNDRTNKHTTVAYVKTRQYITIHRTVRGHIVDVL